MSAYEAEQYKLTIKIQTTTGEDIHQLIHGLPVWLDDVVCHAYASDRHWYCSVHQYEIQYKLAQLKKELSIKT